MSIVLCIVAMTCITRSSAQCTEVSVSAIPSQAGCKMAIMEVVWEAGSLSSSNTVTGNSVTRTVGTSTTDGNAFSYQSVVDNGYLETVVAETNLNRGIGLSATDVDGGLTSIQYGFYLTNLGTLYVRDNGTSGPPQAYSTGDLLRIAVENNVVRFYQNGTPIYTSAVVPTLPLYADACLINTGATINNVLIAVPTQGAFNVLTSGVGTPPLYEWKLNGSNVGTNSNAYSNAAVTAGDVIGCDITTAANGCVASTLITSNSISIIDRDPTLSEPFYIEATSTANACVIAETDVVWQLPVSAQKNLVYGNSLINVSSTNQWDGNAFSYQSVVNNGYILTTAGETDKERMVGLSATDVDDDYQTIDYGFRMGNLGVLNIYEGGLAVPTAYSYATGDVLKISIENGTVKYYQNGGLLHISVVTPTLPLYVDVSTREDGATVNNVRIGNPVNGTFTATSTNAGTTPLYQWSVNGSNVGTGTTYVNTGLNPNDIVECKLTPSTPSCTGTSYPANRIVIKAYDPSHQMDLYTSSVPVPAGCLYAIADARWLLSSIAGGVVATGNTVTKMANEGQWDGNAFSLQGVYPEGYMEATITGPTQARFIGLNSVDIDGNFFTIRYGFYLEETGMIQIYEDGVPKTVQVPYATGDKLRISARYGVISYFKNGVLMYTSTLPPSFPLYVDMSLKRIPGQLSDIVIANVTQGGFTVGSTGGGTSPVYQWKLNGISVGTNSPNYNNPLITDGDIVECTITPDQNGCSGSAFPANVIRISPFDPISPDDFRMDLATAAPACMMAKADVAWRRVSVHGSTLANYNELTKFGGVDGWNAGAFSWDKVHNDGYMETTVNENYTRRAIGLSSVDVDDHVNSIEFGFLLENTGELRVVENGVTKFSIPGPTGYFYSNVLRISVEDGIVRYYKNGVPLYASTTSPSLPLFVDVALYNVQATIKNVQVANSTRGDFGLYANPVIVGATPTFQWQLNSTNVGTNSATYSNASLSVGDIVECRVAPSLNGCGGVFGYTREYTIEAAHPGKWTELWINSDTDPTLCGNTITDVYWRATASLPNHHITGNNLEKVNQNNQWDGNAYSAQPVLDNGFVQTTALETNTRRAIGLSNTDINGDVLTIDFAFVMLSNATAVVRENGSAPLAVTNYTTGDELRIEVNNGIVQYLINGAVLYTSTVTPTFPLYVDVSTNSIGATLQDVKVGNVIGSTYTATALNAGTNPIYQWFVNGAPVGANAATYTNASLTPGDVVSCETTPDLNSCSTSTYSSNVIRIGANTTTNWLGNSTVWNDPENWSAGVPNKTRDAVITGGANNPTIFLNTTIHSIMIGVGKTLTLAGAGRIVEVTGNWTNNGVLVSNNSEVIFTGCDAPNIISSNNTEGFYDLTIKNSFGVNISVGTHTVSHNMDFVDGIVTNSAILNILSNATATNASNQSHVVGPVQKSGTQAFVYPVGSGTYYRPIAISSPTANSTLSAEYHFVNSNGLYPHASRVPSINNLDLCEYWDLDRITGAGNVQVTLSWNAAATPLCLVTDPSELVVARWSGSLSEWQDHGNSGTTGNAANGTVSGVGAQSELGPYTLASPTGLNPLPVELIAFEAINMEKVVNLVWTTASERNSELFIIERSGDALNFEPILSTPGAGTTLSVRNYSLLDEDPLNGTSYYRLLQLDHNGDSDYSNVVAVHRTHDQGDDNLTIFPNPSDGMLNVLFKDQTDVQLFIELFDLSGRRILANYGYAPLFQLDASGLKAGAYRVVVSTEDKTTRSRTWVKY